MSGGSLIQSPAYDVDSNIGEENIQDLSSSANFKFDFKVPTPGEVVECVTEVSNFNGEVLVYDDAANFIVLRDATRSKPQMHIVNLAHIICITKISAPQTNFSFLPPNISKEIVQRRLDIAQKKKDISWKILDASNASDEAIRAYFELEKLFGDVRWDGEKIIALRCLVVREPFDENSVKPIDNRSSSIDAMARVKKILMKLHTRKNCSENDTSIANNNNVCMERRTIDPAS